MDEDGQDDVEEPETPVVAASGPGPRSSAHRRKVFQQQVPDDEESEAEAVVPDWEAQGRQEPGWNMEDDYEETMRLDRLANPQEYTVQTKKKH
ncbi:hypothetical protein P7C70_g2964, partial [Phenoliferia sp. Uapishka_3]